MAGNDFPVVIVGAGPAGSTISLFLSDASIPHLILEKEVFPRDKICGDAISGKGLEIIARLKKEEVLDFGNRQEKALNTKGMRFVAPNGKAVDIPFPQPKGDLPVGFLSRRTEFDQFLFSLLPSPHAEIWQGAELKDAIYHDNGVELLLSRNGKEERINTKMVIGADGSRSVVKRKLQGFEQDDNHFCGGIRAYYKNVEGLHQENYLELHFIKDILPGYFWIFPLPNGYTNIGMGMLSKHIKKNRVNLREKMTGIIDSHPEFRERFQGAQLDGRITGWGLPLGSKKRPVSGNNFLLTGDAASLIDPFTGEGIGNAIVSGLVASRVAVKAVNCNTYSADFLQREYDTVIYQKLWNELQLSYRIQRLTTLPWLFNFVVNRIHGSKALQDVFTNMFNDLDLRSQMKNPLFYFRLFLSR